MAIAFEGRIELRIDDLENSGGLLFSHESIAPYALIGLKVGIGSLYHIIAPLISGVTPIYGVLNDNGTISNQEMMGPRFGSNEPFEMEYRNSGSVIVGLNFKQGSFVDQLQIVWQKWTSNGLDGIDERTEYCGGQGGKYKEIHAPKGCVATGIYGRCGAVIDRISLIACKPVKT
jgi:hypothetical protein